MTAHRPKDPGQWDIDTLIESVGALDDKARAGALSVLAHHLTVETRILLSDPPFDDATLARVRAVNEFEHHLTSRLHPDGRRSPEGDISLLNDIAVDAERSGLTAAIKRGLVIAVRNAIGSNKGREQQRSVAAY